MSVRATCARMLPKSPEGLIGIATVAMFLAMLGSLCLGMVIARAISPELMWIPMLGGVALAIAAAAGISVWCEHYLPTRTDLKASAGPRH